MGKNTITAKRFEDMSPTGFLKLLRQSDGDIIVEVSSQEMFGVTARTTRSVSVEFCTSGGQSHNTLMALIGLMDAIEKDNKEKPQHREV